MEKQPANTWIRPKSTGMEVDDDNDLDNVPREYADTDLDSVFKETVDEILAGTDTLEPALKYVDVIKSITPQEVEETLKNIAKDMEQNTPPATEKKTRTRAPKATTGKTATPEEMIANMEGKIELLKIINCHKNIEIPAANTMKLAQRELLIGYQNAMDKLKSDTVQLISQL
jgi:hypothetical protein